MKLKQIFPIILLAGISTLNFAQKVNLEYNLEKGNYYQWEMILDQEIDMKVQGQDMSMTQKIEFFTGNTVQEVFKDSFRIEQKIERVKMNQQVMGMTVNYDSDSPNSSDPMAAQMDQMFKSFIGEPMIIVLDKLGNTVRTDLGKLEDNPEFARNAGSTAQFIIFPEKTLKVGDSWEDTINPLVETGIITKVKYTLAKVESGTATLKFEGDVTSIEGNELGMNMSGKQKGEVKIDLKSGWTDSSEITQDMEMEINQNGMIIPAKVKGTAILKTNK
jgi:hypothetical protein